MVVEDSKLQAESLTKILQEDGYAVNVVHDGISALDMLGKSLPDLIVSDVWMPNMNGYELCQRLEKFCSAQCNPGYSSYLAVCFDNVIKGLRAGADYY